MSVTTVLSYWDLCRTRPTPRFLCTTLSPIHWRKQYRWTVLVLEVNIILSQACCGSQLHINVFLRAIIVLMVLLRNRKDGPYISVLQCCVCLCYDVATSGLTCIYCTGIRATQLQIWGLWPPWATMGHTLSRSLTKVTFLNNFYSPNNPKRISTSLENVKLATVIKSKIWK